MARPFLFGVQGRGLDDPDEAAAEAREAERSSRHAGHCLWMGRRCRGLGLDSPRRDSPRFRVGEVVSATQENRPGGGPL